MTNVDRVRDQILQRLTNAVSLGDGVLRGTRVYQDNVFATTYVDLSDDIVERSRDLARFQERLLGESFFEGEGTQRWNSYLYLWAGPRSTRDADFQEAKSRIERDRHYARKFVLTEEDLLSRIDDISRSRPTTVVSQNPVTVWSGHLRQSCLEILLEQRPRAQMIRQIESGEAFVMATSPTHTENYRKNDPLGSGMLRALRVSSFRSRCLSGPFIFGDINLITGPNGSGKTSLLELIEALYCGRIRRDPSATCIGITATLEMPDGKPKEVTGATDAATIKARNRAWYGRSDHLASMISEGFTRFNFLDTDAAFRLANDTKVEKIQDDLSRLLVGSEASALWGYLAKLYDDVSTSLRFQDQRLAPLNRQKD